MKANTAQKVEQATQSYHRVINGSSKNDTVVIQAFLDRGIIATPRIDVFKYNDWLYVSDPATGKERRQVRKGEKSVKVRTMVDDEKNGVKTGKKRPATACLFHISQTDPVEGEAGAWDRQDPATAKFTEVQPGISVMVT